MAKVIVRVKVKDYDKWHSFFTSDEATKFRENSGMQGYQIFCAENDPNDISMIHTWDDIDRARKFAQSPQLQEMIKRSGVLEGPSVYLFKDSGGATD